ncbi:hypothetical protein [Peptoniphilus duerdenii]|uniref:hypothetical protein n=1 Tax=Peptoniphilus duerdenii TaxID=507750 RepID=UPI00254A445C|nr:hypothetical protein [Peptoniphilus duerdenii]MDK8275813.1 hypothetical protein [Peptoniphilus duerdenii]
MKVRFIGETDPIYMINGKIYEVLSIEKGWFRIIDEEGEDYLYPPELFQVVDEKNRFLK